MNGLIAFLLALAPANPLVEQPIPQVQIDVNLVRIPRVRLFGSSGWTHYPWENPDKHAGWLTLVSAQGEEQVRLLRVFKESNLISGESTGTIVTLDRYPCINLHDEASVRMLPIVRSRSTLTLELELAAGRTTHNGLASVTLNEGQTICCVMKRTTWLPRWLGFQIEEELTSFFTVHIVMPDRDVGPRPAVFCR